MMTGLNPFGNVPSSALQQPAPFTVNISEAKLQEFETLLDISPLADRTYENLQADWTFGVTRDWMADTKEYWANIYDWRKQEARINSFPNFKTSITDIDGEEFEIHFAALFSRNISAIPIALFHGWPGSFIEFLPILDLIASQHTPETLPYHIVVPSLPGYTLSSSLPLDRDWNNDDTARIMHRLLLSLGFGNTGYIAQGGDIGSYISRILAASYPECKAAHVNFMFPLANGALTSSNTNLTDGEREGLARFNESLENGFAYALVQGTRPSTMGFVLASSPVAHLAWIGEKLVTWSDPSTVPSLDEILTNIMLYWFAGSYPSSIYPYRGSVNLTFLDKPTGYSYFQYEVRPVPRSWASEAVNMVYFNRHERGGHFAALENPEALWSDVEEFVKLVWK